MDGAQIRRLNVGTLNVRGCKEDYQKQTLVNDCLKYDIQICGISETHISGDDLAELTSTRSDTKQQRTYSIFYVGKENDSFHGVGLVIEKHLNPSFKRISDRICLANIKLKNRDLYVISAYAPTLKVSEDHPELRETFYEQLDTTVSSISKKHALFLLGDFNAKTGDGFEYFPQNMGAYGKGQTNSSGRMLLELAQRHNLVLTNTLFRHKLAHISTWEAPEKIHTDRRNPVRNQIDYIITKCEHRKFIKNSRAYNGIETSTDHKLVKMEINFEWFKLNKIPQSKPNINVQNFNYSSYQTAYKIQLEKNYHYPDPTLAHTQQERWDNITKVCRETAEEVLGLKERHKKNKYDDPEIKQLSETQKTLKTKIESCQDKATRRSLKTERNRIMKEIRKLIRKLEDERLDKELQNIESYKDDSNKMYQAIRELNMKQPKKPLQVFNEKGMIASSSTEQVDIITKHFSKLLTYKDDSERKVNVDELNIKPHKMNNPFTAKEIQTATKRMKNGKSTGIDLMTAEFVKYAPDTVHKQTAEILNITAETGEHPREIRKGLLTPLPKPGKKQGPPANLRPIILLSVLRKILAICLLKRIWDRLSSKIPKSQAAYQSGRSTTEQVFAIKLLAEKALISENYTIYLLMLDMSKAFDTVDRPRLMKDLAEVLEPDELHMLHILINDVEYNVKVGDTVGETIQTEIGIAQGDCLSAVLFIYYLANALTPKRDSTELEHNYAKHHNTTPGREETLQWSELDYITVEEKHHFEIDPKYADDTNWASTNKERINQIKRETPAILEESNLFVNNDKTERYDISRKGNDRWKSCKILGSLLDTECDINRRKSLAIAAYNKLRDVFDSRKISDCIKIRIYNAYVQSIFLYNSELWTLSKKLEKRINTFQRRQLRSVLGCHWPRIITNEQLYKRTNTTPWTNIIKRRRLSWLGHVMRLDPDTPARQSLEEFFRKTPRPRGRPTTTWIEIINKDLGNLIDFKQPQTVITHLSTICENRANWRNIVEGRMLQEVATR